jgi:hypothetical protein
MKIKCDDFKDRFKRETGQKIFSSKKFGIDEPSFSFEYGYWLECRLAELEAERCVSKESLQYKKELRDVYEKTTGNKAFQEVPTIEYLEWLEKEFLRKEK